MSKRDRGELLMLDQRGLLTIESSKRSRSQTRDDSDPRITILVPCSSVGEARSCCLTRHFFQAGEVFKNSCYSSVAIYTERRQIKLNAAECQTIHSRAGYKDTLIDSNNRDSSSSTPTAARELHLLSPLTVSIRINDKSWELMCLILLHSSRSHLCLLDLYLLLSSSL